MANIIDSMKNTLNEDERNERVNREIAGDVDYYRFEPEEALREKIATLDNEWDVERTIDLNASLLVLTGIILAAAVSKKWLILPALVSGFLAQRALLGTAATLFPFGNRRTREEIAREKFGLSEILNSDSRPAMD